MFNTFFNYQNIYSQGKNKVSLRNLSMVLRQEVSSTTEQKIKNIQQGVEYAREAVSLDPTDGTSWAILGNAYLSSFFMIAQNPSILKLCMSAYGQAVSFFFMLIAQFLYENK